MTTLVLIGMLALALVGSAGVVVFWPKQPAQTKSEEARTNESSASALKQNSPQTSPIPSGSRDNKKDWMNTHYDCDSESTQACVMCWTHMDTEEERCCFRSTEQIAAEDDFCTRNDPEAKKRYLLDN